MKWVFGLKVLTNEKRGGLKMVSFDRSPFKLISLRFSYKSVQAPQSVGGLKLLSEPCHFEINNCLQRTA